jgi:hypothetical protein
MDETQTTPTVENLDPLEPEAISTEGFQGDQSGLLNGKLEQLKTAGTSSKLNLEDGKVLDIIVNDDRQILDKDGKLIEIEPDPEQPIAHLLQEVEVVDDDNNKTNKWVKIGIVSLAGIAAGISIARFISAHRPPQNKA